MGSLEEDAKTVFKAHPAFFFFVVGVGALVLLYSIKTFAQKVDLDQMRKDITGIKQDIAVMRLDSDIQNTETRLTTLSSEIYALERLEFSGEAMERDLKRLDDLRIERAALEREIVQKQRAMEILAPLLPNPE